MKSKYEYCEDCIGTIINFEYNNNYYSILLNCHYPEYKRYLVFIKFIGKKHHIFEDGGTDKGIDYKMVRISMVDPTYMHSDDDDGWELDEDDIEALIHELSSPYEDFVFNPYIGEREKIKCETLFKFLMIFANYEDDELYDVDMKIPNYHKLLKGVSYDLQYRPE